MMSDLRESGCLTADTRMLRADTGAEIDAGRAVRVRRDATSRSGRSTTACATSAGT